MDRATLEELLARLGSAANRRKTVKGLLGGALASAATLTEAAAKGKSGRNKKRKQGKDKDKSKDSGKAKSGQGNRDGKGKDHAGAGKQQHKGKGKGKDHAADPHQDDANDTVSARKDASAEVATERRGNKSKRCKKNGRNCRELQANAHLATN
ncbi:MAG: hypothetical protein U0031_00095 [Thermomicrobiales bacterium]